MHAAPPEPPDRRRRCCLTVAAALTCTAAGLAQQWNFLDGPAYGGRTAAFDWTRGRLVSLGQDGATWEFDDDQLLSRAVDGASPPPRWRGTMVYDLARRNQVWRLANGAWSLLTSSTNLQLGGPTAMDPLRQRLVSNKGTVIAELTSTPGAVGSVGSGCGTPVPALQARARPRLGETGFGLEMRTETLLPVLFALSPAPANLPLGNGCALRIGAPAFTAFVPSNFAGQAELTLPIPAITSLRGVALYAQAVTPAPAGGALPLSQGLRLQLGD